MISTANGLNRWLIAKHQPTGLLRNKINEALTGNGGGFYVQSTMVKNKKMSNLGLIMMLIGGILVAFGGFVYNKYSGKSRNENHKELISKQDELSSKLDSNKDKIIKSVEENNSSLNQKEQTVTEKREPKNQIINNAPNQGVQINENNGTVIVPKPLSRTFTKEQAKNILKGYPHDFPIEVWLKGTTNESKKLFDQVVEAIQQEGYTNISTTTIGLYLNPNEVIEKDFQYKLESGKIVFSIYPQQ